MNDFEHFRSVRINLPCENWARCYDIEHEIIWINTAAEESNNVVKLSPAKW